jgi:Uncharacterized conserved protein (COG2071)
MKRLTGLQRHPFPLETTLTDSFVMLYAVDAKALERFCPPGLALERVGQYGLVALATVRAKALRLRGTPSWAGRDFMLTGYRVIVRFRAPDGTVRRALRIIQSDTDSRAMTIGGNIFTEYNYRRTSIVTTHLADQYAIQIGSEPNISLIASAHINEDNVLPTSSPFRSPQEARRYTGPLPWTVGYVAPSNTFVAVRGHRGQWRPRLVQPKVERNTFFERPEFRDAEIRLAAGFFIDQVSYSWDKGIRLSASAVALPVGEEAHDDEI